MLCALVLAMITMTSPEPDVLPLIDAADMPRTGSWRPVHDGVMGGVSRGQVLQGEETTRFEGEVSLENNGGFASFRLTMSFPDLTSHDGFLLRVRGDGQVYKLSVRVDGGWDGVSWQAPFATEADRWTTVQIAFEDLVPTWRGRLVSQAPPFDPGSVEQLGLMIADKQAGPYALELASLDAWRAGAPARGIEGTRVAARARSAGLAEALDAGRAVSEVVDSMRWNERLLVVAAPGELDAESSIQIGRLLAAREDLDARELRVVNLMGVRGGRVAARTLGSEAVQELRERWNAPAGEWALLLVGKDGGVKNRWSSVVEPTRIFAEIDVMLMRRTELTDRR